MTLLNSLTLFAILLVFSMEIIISVDSVPVLNQLHQTNYPCNTYSVMEIRYKHHIFISCISVTFWFVFPSKVAPMSEI